MKTWYLIEVKSNSSKKFSPTAFCDSVTGIENYFCKLRDHPELFELINTIIDKIPLDTPYTFGYGEYEYRLTKQCK